MVGLGVLLGALGVAACGSEDTSGAGGSGANTTGGNGGSGNTGNIGNTGSCRQAPGSRKTCSRSSGYCASSRCEKGSTERSSGCSEKGRGKERKSTCFRSEKASCRE